MAAEVAVAYGIDTQQFAAVINCESHWNQRAIGSMGERGLVQIYPKAWPEISSDQAYNAFFSLNWAAQQWAAGNQHIWTCYRKLFGNG